VTRDRHDLAGQRLVDQAGELVLGLSDGISAHGGLVGFTPSATAISLRLAVSPLEQIKIAAHNRDAPYQSAIKMWLAEKVG